jgi:hypothetical protein
MLWHRKERGVIGDSEKESKKAILAACHGHVHFVEWFNKVS